jgi:hypothetical protein
MARPERAEPGVSALRGAAPGPPAMLDRHQHASGSEANAAEAKFSGVTCSS